MKTNDPLWFKVASFATQPIEKYKTNCLYLGNSLQAETAILKFISDKNKIAPSGFELDYYPVQGVQELGLEISINWGVAICLVVIRAQNRSVARVELQTKDKKGLHFWQFLMESGPEWECLK